MFFKWPKFCTKIFIALSALLFLNFGLPLRATLFITSEKPLFVKISTDWCFACKMLQPTVEELKKEYGDKVEFVELDPTGEEKLKISEITASDYGIGDFFKEHRNVFPTVGIISPSGNIEKIIVGANNKEAYKKVLDNLLGLGNITENEQSTKPVSEDGNKPQDIQSGRPDEPKRPERPPPPDFLEDNQEPATAGRPPEIKFWQAGQPIPYYAYNHYLVLPGCSASNNVLCANNKSAGKQGINEPPVFKPWNTGTRDEKGLQLKKREAEEQ